MDTWHATKLVHNYKFTSFLVKSRLLKLIISTLLLPDQLLQNY